jgi:hypothetical protein
MFTLNSAAADCFIDWLVASYDRADLSWRNDAGLVVYTQPGCDLFMGADDELFDAWENLNYGQQSQCIRAAADWLFEVEVASAAAATGL